MPDRPQPRPERQRRAHNTQAAWNSTHLQTSSEPEEAARFLTCCFRLPRAARRHDGRKMKLAVEATIKSQWFAPRALLEMRGRSPAAYGSAAGNRKEVKTRLLFFFPTFLLWV